MCVCVCVCVCVLSCAGVCERVVGVEFDVGVKIGFQYLVATCSFALACSQVLLPRWSNLFLHVFLCFRKTWEIASMFVCVVGPYIRV